MLSKLEYASFLNYSVQGAENVPRWSREVAGTLKSARKKGIVYAIDHKKFNESLNIFSSFLNSDTILVPVPGSKKYSKDYLWSNLSICQILLEKGLGKEVKLLITRKEKIRKSSECKSTKDRPTVIEHINTLQVHPQILPTSSITLIDDVVSAGSISMACAQMLYETYPTVTIKLFAFMKTKSGNVTDFVDPTEGVIVFRGDQGTSFRRDQE